MYFVTDELARISSDEKTLKTLLSICFGKSQNLDMSSAALPLTLTSLLKSNSLNLQQSPPIIVGRVNSEKVLQSLLEVAFLKLHILRFTVVRFQNQILES